MNRERTIVIPAKIVSWKRAGRQGKRYYTNPRAAAYREAIILCAKRHFREPFRGPIGMRVDAVFGSKTRHAQYKATTPDIDNVAKIVLDALNGLAYDDDRQVAELTCTKIWGPRDIVTVHVRELCREY